MSRWYIWDRRTNEVRPAEVMEAAAWYEDVRNRRLDFTRIGEARIFTTFLGFDHAFLGGVPVLWESMTFWPGHEMDQEPVRYLTHAEAVAGHAAMVERVRAAMKEADA